MEKIDLSCKTQRPLKKESNKQSRFIDLTHDYGFKIVMADENHPELMLGFLNAIIPERKIVSISFLNTEQLPTVEEHHRVNYDVLCIVDASNRDNIEQGKLSIYDKMVRDEIQIAAEREYAVNEARIAALAEGRAEGHAEGHAEGQYEANLAVAEKLKLAGADIELISQCTGLSVEEINAL
ncbi:MAG: PD-(D/E)XK nuclease family transposase [Bacteroidaceae bacterium]|nr:PD-(D/E)XK nuclease family transposase [Bacteroidaceae bacterium]